MAAQSFLDYTQFVVVAEDQCKINLPVIRTNTKCNHCNHSLTKCCNCNRSYDVIKAAEFKFSVYLAGYEWEYTFAYPKHIQLEFKGFARGRLTEVHLEVLLCDEKFKPLLGFPIRQMLTTESSVWKSNFTTTHECFNMTIRVLKDRPYFPDFTSKDVQICANNVAGLLALAQCYQVDLVRDKCEHHLKFCREMPASERLVLAKKYGLKEVQFHIVQEMNTLKDCKELFYASLEADP